MQSTKGTGEISMHSHRDIFDKLGLSNLNPGACFGPGQWSASDPSRAFDCFNPTNGQSLGQITAATAADYEKVILTATEAAQAWRQVPAPIRGEAVRRVTNALRDYKDPLGSLVALEMGKIKPEGDGEVQEMIDIGDFALGQSRMLYGKTMHSERPGHRMYEQWHPLGVVGVVTAFNFPVAVWAWNALLSAICGNATVWKPSPKGALC